jgi:hypothetical protein
MENLNIYKNWGVITNYKTTYDFTKFSSTNIIIF